MIESVDRLPPEFYIEQELQQMAEDVVNGDKFSTIPKHICWYHLYKDGVSTSKAMLLAVESIVDGRDAINRICKEIGLTAQIGEYGDESVTNNLLIEHIYIVLEAYRYNSNTEFTGSNKVYNYDTWMNKLVRGTARFK